MSFNLAQAALLAAALTVVGCASTRIPPNDPAHVAAHEGLVILVVDTNVPLEGVTFEPVAGKLAFTVPDLEPGVDGHLFRVPPGRYVLRAFRTPDGIFDEGFEGKELCLEVTAGRLNYPGHLVFRQAASQEATAGQIQWGFRRNEPDLKARLQIGWPGLRDRIALSEALCPASAQ